MNYTVHEGVPDGTVWGLAQDREGTMWAATTGGLARLEGNRWKELGKEWNFPGKIANAVFLDHQGTLWVATEDTLVFLPAGAKMFQPTGIRVGQVMRFAQAASGKLWMAETTKSVRPVPLSDQRQPPDKIEVEVGSTAILFASDGALWVTSIGDGLRRAPAPELLKGKVRQFGTEVESFTFKDGLSDDYASAILQDREGNIWVGTNNGLDRFDKTNLVPVALPFKPTLDSVLAAGDGGDVWLADPNSMIHVHRDHAEPDPGTGHTVASAYSAPAGVIWWFSPDAIDRYEAGNYSTIALPPGLKPYGEWSMEATEDGSGALWLAVMGEGLFYRKEGTWRRPDAPPEFTKLSPRAAFTDWMGRVWFGYGGGKIIILDHAKVEKVFRAEDSVVGGVRTIGGRGRHTWVGGELGLAFFDGDRLRRVMPAGAETLGSVLGVEESSDGSLWLAGSRGAIEIPSREVQEVLVNPSYRVKYRIFDASDGLPGSFLDRADLSVEIQGTDGRLWFLASDGIAWLDPRNISQNALPPPVSIRSVRANGRQFGSQPSLALPAGTTNLQIAYTALSLSAPEKVHFRYKLERVDKDWEEAGTRREAFYTRLGPGKYRFRVTACNNDGVWNEEGVHLDFDIAPAWYQTSWFRVACFLVGLWLLWALHELRMRQAARALSLRFDERLSERTRIAREFHDTLLQTIQGSKLVAEHALKSSDDRIRMVRALEQLADWLGRATEEGRAALNSLRMSTTQRNDLAEALKRATEECRTQSPMKVSFSVVGDAKEMHPVVRDELYRIGYEAIRNACTHSRARRLDVALSYTRDLSLRVSDDGAGIDPSIADRGRDGHFGLPGMRERAARIGGKLTVVSSANSGTEITVVVPGGIVFKTSSSPFERLHSILKRMSGTPNSH